MTREETYETIKIMKAWADFERFKYRINPKPEMVPWDNPADVPMNCWIALKCDTDRERHLITECKEYGVVFGGKPIQWRDLSDCYSWTVDGKTWHPCTKKKEN